MSKFKVYRTSREAEQEITFQPMKLLMDSILGRFQRCIESCGEINEWLSPILKQFLKLIIHLFFVVLRWFFEEKLRTLSVSFFEPSYIFFYVLYGPVTITKGLQSHGIRIQTPVLAIFLFTFYSRNYTKNLHIFKKMGLSFLNDFVVTPLIKSNKSTGSVFKSQHLWCFAFCWKFYIKLIFLKHQS